MHRDVSSTLNHGALNFNRKNPLTSYFRQGSRGLTVTVRLESDEFRLDPSLEKRASNALRLGQSER
jgi:hypothetical protein